MHDCTAAAANAAMVKTLYELVAFEAEDSREAHERCVALCIMPSPIRSEPEALAVAVNVMSTGGLLLLLLVECGLAMLPAWLLPFVL